MPYLPRTVLVAISLSSVFLLMLGDLANAAEAVFWSAPPTFNPTQLWVTNGTASGTKALTVKGASSRGVVPLNPDFTSFHGRALFVGQDSKNQLSVWTTDGSEAGTKELSVPSVAPKGLLSDHSPEFTVLGDKVIFRGKGASASLDGLWVTTGDNGGTLRLNPKGASLTDGLFGKELSYAYFTVFGNKAVFAGKGASQNDSMLWVTDGTSAGTTELKVAGALNSGLFADLSANSGFPDFTRFGSKVLFVGEDANSNFGLWVTDGSGSGTHEIKVATATGGLFYRVPQPDITVLGNKAIFLGVDAMDNENLWVTNGTTAGTKKLAIKGVYLSGIFFDTNFYSPSFTVFRGKAFFSGENSLGQNGLWYTDGTSEGTRELKVPGASTRGILSDFAELVVLGSKLIFIGLDSKGNYNLYATDGTLAGTHKIVVSGTSSLMCREYPYFTLLAGKLLFASCGSGLWSTDGTSAGTKQISSAAVQNLTAIVN